MGGYEADEVTSLTRKSALKRYKDGGGNVKIPLDDIDFSSLDIRNIKKIRSLLFKGEKGDFDILTKHPFQTTGDEASYLGRVTLKIEGTLTINKGTYVFVGSVKVFDDKYDFNTSNRGLLGEALTWYGRNFVKGTPYWIRPVGELGIGASGRLPKRNSRGTKW